MNKKAKEMGIIGTILFLLVLIFLGLVALSQNNSGNEQAETVISSVFGPMVWIGIFGLLILVVTGLLVIIKKLQ